MKITGKTVTAFGIAAVIALGALVVMGLVGTVEAGYVGILTRSGVAADSPMMPGTYRLGLGESITLFDTRVQRLDYQGSAASKDLQEVVGVISLNFRVAAADVPTIFTTIGVDYRQRVIEPAVQETFKATMAQFTSSELITQRDAVKRVAQDLLSGRLGRFGIAVEELNVLDFRFSQQFKSAIEAANAAKQAVVEEEQKLRSAQIQAQQRVAVAKADAEATLARAEAEASANKTIQTTLTPEVLQYLALTKWDGKLPQSTNGSVPFLNLVNR
jgi:regulator of protease activity HflC (stomatin/prohibitin superfamily)